MTSSHLNHLRYFIPYKKLIDPQKNGVTGASCTTDVDATISQNNETRDILRASSPREVTRERHVTERSRESKLQGKKARACRSSAPHGFAALSHVCFPLEMERFLSVNNISC